jgi:abhydrolase domain-containing protein 6
MTATVSNWFDLADLVHAYERQIPVVLVNGLAEQSESWFANRTALSRYFDVKVPELLVYDGDSLHQRIDAGGEISVDYLAHRLSLFIDEFVQRTPCYLVASSLGCQVALTAAVERPESVSKLVLICPSGFHGHETLPMIEGVRRSAYGSMVRSVFHRSRFASDELVATMHNKFQDRKWKKGVLRTLRGTVGHSVAPLLPLVSQSVLVIWGAQDRVLSDLPGAIQAGEQIRRVRQAVIPRCGHAPQIERAGLVNRLISQFLRDKLKSIPPALAPHPYLNRAANPSPYAGGSIDAPSHSVQRIIR